MDNAVYVDGTRHVEPTSLEQTFETMREVGGMAWIGLYRPDAQEIEAVAAEFGIHPLAVEDAISAHQRPKLERFGEILFVVVRPARYVDADEKVEFGEVHVLLGKDFVVTVRHAESPDLAGVRERMEHTPDLLRHGPEAVLYAILDEVVDQYAPVVAGLENDIDEIEDELFAGSPAVTRRIYELSREVIAFQRATHPLLGMLDALHGGAEKYQVDIELLRHLRDVHDHVLRVVERVDSFRALLQNALTVSATVVNERQNEDIRAMTQAGLDQNEQVKKISSWAAIFFAPTLVASIYGMNFRHMPELGWWFGYPMAVGLMVVSGLALFAAFRHRRWL